MSLQSTLFAVAFSLIVSGSNCDGQPTESQVKNLKKSAFVVGINNYDDHSEELNNAVSDALEVADALKSLGFDPKIDTNVNKDKLTNDLISWTESLRDKKVDVAIFYFAGHGAQIGDDNCLYPKDAVFSDDGNVVTNHTYSAKSLMRDMLTSNDGIDILVLDACRDNPTRASKKNLAKNGLYSMKLPRPGILIGYPVLEGETEPDGDPGGHSLYATAFVDNIKRPNVGIKTIFGKIADEVYRLSKGKQAPFMKTSVGDDNDIWLSYSNEKGVSDLLGTTTAKEDIASFRRKLALTTDKVPDDTLGSIFTKVDQITNSACNRLRDSLGKQFNLSESHGPDYTNSQCINYYQFGDINYSNKLIIANVTTKVTATQILVLIEEVKNGRFEYFDKTHHLATGLSKEISRFSPDWDAVYQNILQYFYDRRDILLGLE
jgi:hypothetical protein